MSPYEHNLIITGDVLRTWRKQAGMTQTEAAQSINIKTRRTINNWERGFSSPSHNHVIALAKKYGTYKQLLELL
ncbi:helix-turn-helix domain-containing protein [Alteromonas sp. a30]|uniref:helix-turn-helix domain-containing protein n=1 Tax=Alteromonas sp. a30 TaxID=2730917 RepID=UPI0022824461|nr:helix-turn-helix transcriptional regulator [Alteromonas sp. a30]MCY7295660.1 helix-turn-helix transcriptional regulator [Alteromonas sp. a30]